MSTWNSIAAAGLAFSFLAGGLACGGSSPRAVRGSEEAGLDDAAFGTGLDRRDLDKMLKENLAALRPARIVNKWRQEQRPTLSVLSMRNETSEHIESALGALISQVETYLVNAGDVRVVSRDSQPEMIAELEAQQSGAFDASTIARLGKQAGVRYFLTGKVHSVDERQAGERRVQYFMAMRVINAETSDIEWQNSAAVTKAIVNK